MTLGSFDKCENCFSSHAKTGTFCGLEECLKGFYRQSFTLILTTQRVNRRINIVISLKIGPHILGHQGLRNAQGCLQVEPTHKWVRWMTP